MRTGKRKSIQAGLIGYRNGSLALLALWAGLATAQTSFKFDFGTGAAEPGYTKVAPSAKYSTAQGHGFEDGTAATAVNRGGSDALRSDFITGTGELFFSVKVPQGNYNLTVVLGDIGGASSTTVKAENKRLLFDRVTLASGQTLARSITVNRREVKSENGAVTMSIKDRELTYYTWDEKLTLRFSGAKIAVCGLELTKVADARNVFLCGNSTVVDQLDPDKSGWCSWGQMIPFFFKPGVSISNYAESGLDAGSFLNMRRLDKIMAEAKEGDYVFVEFGHNDQGNGPAPYKASLKIFRDKIVAGKAIPVFVAPTSRKGDTDPKTSIGGMAETMRATAKELNVTLVDLNAMSITFNKALGADMPKVYRDGSHFMDFGAFELARCVAKDMVGMSGLAPFLATDLPVFDPTKPDPADYLTRPGSTVGLFQEGKAPLIRARPVSGMGSGGQIEFPTLENGEPGKRILDGRKVPGEMPGSGEP